MSHELFDFCELLNVIADNEKNGYQNHDHSKETSGDIGAVSELFIRRGARFQYFTNPTPDQQIVFFQKITCAIVFNIKL